MDAFLSFHAPGFWLVMALLGAIVALGSRPFLPTAARTPVILAYWLLLPYLALLSGGVSPRLMGLVYIDWALSLRIGMGLAFGLIVLTLGMRAASSFPSLHTRRDASPDAPLHRWGAIVVVIILCGAEEFFWAFLRGASAELLVNLQFSLTIPGYWAIWVAAALAAPVALINAPGAYGRLIKATILVLSSIVFFYTRNFWLCWLLHAAVWLIFLQPVRLADRSVRRDAAPNGRTQLTERSQSQQ
jgi:hypothetical protein